MSSDTVRGYVCLGMGWLSSTAVMIPPSNTVGSLLCATSGMMALLAAGFFFIVDLRRLWRKW